MSTLALVPTIPATDWRWVAAAPFRAHLRHLMSETQLPWRALAGHAGVPDRVVRGLLLGRAGRPMRRIAPHYARRLLRLTPEQLQRSLQELIPSDQAQHAAHLLLGAGWSPRELMTVAEVTRPEIDALLMGQVSRVPRRVQTLLAAAARAHQLTPLEPAEHTADHLLVAA